MELKNKNLQKIYTSLEKDKETLSSEELKKKYLSKEGLLTKAFIEISKIAQKERAQYGQEANKLKTYIRELIESNTNFTNTYPSKDRIDPTAPFDINTKIEDRPQFLDTKGTQHPLTKDIETFVDIFKGMGFDVLESRQLDDDYHMFESLNFPVGHPARDMYDTFWTEDGLILPAHTSTMQNRAMKMFGPPPIAVILPGRCFRHEATDASHEHTFHQMRDIYR